MSATIVETTTLDQLKAAQDALKGIDLRTLPRTGDTRDEVKNARSNIASAIRTLQ